MWIDDVVSSIGKIIPMRIESRTDGWCCTKHELEFSPEELELVTILVQLSLHHRDEQTLRAVYNVIVNASKQSRQHTVIHVRAEPTQLVVALRKIKKEETIGGLNVEL